VFIEIVLIGIVHIPLIHLNIFMLDKNKHETKTLLRSKLR